MTDASIRVLAIIAAEAGVDPAALTPATLLADIGCDALSVHLIAMALEDELDVAICDAAMEMWRSCGDVLASITPRGEAA